MNTLHVFIYQFLFKKYLKIQKKLQSILDNEKKNNSKLFEVISNSYNFIKTEMGQSPVIFITFSRIQGLLDKFSEYEKLKHRLVNLIDSNLEISNALKNRFPSSSDNNKSYGTQFVETIDEIIKKIGHLTKINETEKEKDFPAPSKRADKKCFEKYFGHSNFTRTDAHQK